LAWESGIAGRENLSEPWAESRSWGAEKTPLKLRGILTTVLETYQRSARR